MRKPHRCGTRSITSTISISRTLRKSGGAAAWLLPGCSISPRFPCWSSPRSNVFPAAFRIPARDAGRFLRPLSRQRRLPFLVLRCTSASPLAAKMILRPRCCPRCAFNLAGTSKRKPASRSRERDSSHRDSKAMNYDHSETNSTAAPCVMTICGAAGDLTKRKLIPALCNLAEEKLLPEQFAVVGFSADDFTTESFRKNLMQEIPKFAVSPIAPQLLDWMCQRTYYVNGDSQDADAYQRLEQQIAEADRKYHTAGNRLFYLAVAPRFFSTIAKMLALCCLSKEEDGHWARVVVEKPFGHDLASAK